MAKPKLPTRKNFNPTPPVWTLDELETQAQIGLNAFVDRRLAETDTSYLRHLAARRKALVRLFKALRLVDPVKPDNSLVQKIVRDDEMFDALRYIAGPPVSEDDLGVLVTRCARRISRTAVIHDSNLATDILSLICRISDSARFPWIKSRRNATGGEIRRAIDTTAILHAAQTMATQRRGYGRQVEALLCQRIERMGYKKVLVPNAGRIDSPIHHPANMTYYPECNLRGRRADIVLGLPDGRLVAVEAKDSSSVVNSVKRVLNDTAAKAKGWHQEMGATVVPVALISGVFGARNLFSAQRDGLYLVWSHDLDSFIDWLGSQ